MTVLLSRAERLGASASEHSLDEWIAQHGLSLESLGVNTKPDPRRVAFVGGNTVDEDALNSHLIALRRKYPDAIVVTGSGRGAEKTVADLAAFHGFTVEIPELAENDKREWQVNDILMGADVIVVVGGGHRVAIAEQIHKRCDAWRPKGRPLVRIATKEKGSPLNRTP